MSLLSIAFGNCTYKLDTYFCNMESFVNLVKEIMYNVVLN